MLRNLHLSTAVLAIGMSTLGLATATAQIQNKGTPPVTRSTNQGIGAQGPTTPSPNMTPAAPYNTMPNGMQKSDPSSDPGMRPSTPQQDDTPPSPPTPHPENGSGSPG